MDLLSNILFAASIIFFYMTFWFVVSIVVKRNDIADIAWGLGFVLVAWCLHLKNSFSLFPPPLIVILTTIWGLRLAWHIYSRNKDKNEDFRYKKWRKDWGKYFYIRSYLQVFLLQGFLMLLISMSVIVHYTGVYAYPLRTMQLVILIGVLVWLLGFVFETVGDWQLSKFISNAKNKGKIMKYGLWKYTRHPNYFGEVTQWWGIYILTLLNPISFIALISPLTITVLILVVSGIPLLERKYNDNKEYQEYKKVTNAFFPWFPR